MAYPIVDAPYGFAPVNLTGGTPFAGATREIPIASNYGTSIFNGDLVVPLTSGTIALAASTTTIPATGFLGVFLGCSYTVPATGQKVFSNYYPANTVASDITAYICDDPTALFKVVHTGTGVNTAQSLTPTYVARSASIFKNAAIVLNTGVVATGRSRMAISSIATTNTLPLRVVDVVRDTANAAGSFCELVVRIPLAAHSYHTALGV
jgi:hypothetical protein